jgi:type I restriction enzyme S subunit
MNKIDELIAQYCPNGVEYKRLEDIFKISRGRVMSKEYLSQNKGKYPVYSSQTANNGQIGKISTYDYYGEYLTWTTDGANAGTIFYRNEKFSITNVCGLLKANSFEILPKFAYYVLSITMKSFVSSGMGNPKLMSNIVAKIQIPVPPLPVQQEIVNILDKFTELEAKLEAELEARRKQYEYYRNQLLTPVEVDGKWLLNGKEVEWKTLGEIAYYPKDRISANLVNETNYVGVDNLLQNRQGKTLSSYVPSTGNLIAFKENDILIGNIRPYLKKIWLSDTNGGTNGDVVIVRIKEIYSNIYNPNFLYFLLSSDSFFDYDMQFAKGSKMPRGDKDAILKYKIPIPPLAEQERIVEILDKFDRLVNDISEGLPAEIEARRKQYEYYRGKLLNFKKRNN